MRAGNDIDIEKEINAEIYTYYPHDYCKELLAEMDKQFGFESYLRFKLWFLFHDAMANPSAATLYEMNYIKNF